MLAKMMPTFGLEFMLVLGEREITGSYQLGGSELHQVLSTDSFWAAELLLAF